MSEGSPRAPAMYSLHWFNAFAPAIEAASSLEVAAISALCPRPDFSRLLEIGCGTGRIAGPMALLGYQVVGLDINDAALQVANSRAPGPKYVAMDQRHVGQMPCTFDCVILLWNSIGFGTRQDDEQTLRGVARVLRTGGKFLIDLYHPEWLADQPSIEAESRGARVRRWVVDGRCFHTIRYDDGTVDDIQFNIYSPHEITAVLTRVGLKVNTHMTWWSAERVPSRVYARYQLECVRVEA